MVGYQNWGNMEQGRENGRGNGREVQTKVKPTFGDYNYWLLLTTFGCFFVLKLKHHQKQNVTKTKIPLKRNCHPNRNITKNEVLSGLKCHQKLNVTNTKISLKLKWHQNKNVIKTEISPELKCRRKNVTKT